MIAAHFPKYAEAIPDGETSKALSKAAKDNGIFVIGGTIPEKEGSKFFNTCTVWDPMGNLVAKYRKVKFYINNFIIYRGIMLCKTFDYRSTCLTLTSKGKWFSRRVIF